MKYKYEVWVLLKKDNDIDRNKKYWQGNSLFIAFYKLFKSMKVADDSKLYFNDELLARLKRLKRGDKDFIA